MAIVVNSHTANVHTHVFRIDGGEGFFLAGKGVVDGGHGVWYWIKKLCIRALEVCFIEMVKTDNLLFLCW